MPDVPRTHDENRCYVCLICRRKPLNFKLGKNMWVIRNKLLELVQRHYQNLYDPDDQFEVDGICTTCRTKLYRVEKKELPASVLGAPIDKSQLYFPYKTHEELRDKQNCDCSNCIIATANAGQLGHDYGGRNQRSHSASAGRPPEPEPEKPKTPPPTSPGGDTMTVCRNCLTEIRKGISHKCTLTQRRENIEKFQAPDPKGAQMAASKVVQQQIAEAQAGGSQNFQLQGGGNKPKNFPIPSPSKNVQAKYADPNTPIPATEFSKLKVNANLSMNQTRQVEKWLRANTGRKSVESGTTEKVREELKSLEPFFKWEYHFFDSSKKSERDGGNKVIRPIVFCHELQKLIKHLREKRGFHSMTKHMIKLGADGGK